MKILITGHTGFIGTNLSAFLRSLDHEIVGCSRRENCDARDASVLKRKIKGCDLAFHLAADARPAESLLSPKETFQVNTETAISVAMSCRDANVPLIYASSCEIYGDCESIIAEETPFMPTNPYSASKAACDRLLYSFYRCFGLNVKIARLFNPYGPFQQLNKIIPTFYRQAKSGNPITVYGDGKDYRDYVFINDIVKGLWEARGLPAGEAVNLSTGVLTRTIDVAQMIIRKTESGSRIQFVPYPKIFGGIRFQVGSNLKAKQMINWSPETTLTVGMDRTIKWLETLV